MKSVLLLVIQILICSTSTKLLQRHIKCNRKNIVVVTLKFSNVGMDDNVLMSHGKSVFKATVCQSSPSNNYCTHKNTIWYKPPCYSKNTLQVKCYFGRKFLKKFDQNHYTYSTFGLKVSILQEAGTGNESAVTVIPFTPGMICWNVKLEWILDNEYLT